MEERHDLLHGAGSINTLGASTSHTTPAAVDMEEEEEEAVKKEEERWVGSGEWRDAFKCDGGSSSRSLERGGLDWTRDRATVAGWLYICVCIIMYISVYLTYTCCFFITFQKKLSASIGIQLQCCTQYSFQC